VNLWHSDTNPFRPEQVVGAIVCVTEQGNLHAGLLYRRGGEVSALHLGWKDRLLDEWSWSGMWTTPSAPIEKLAFAAGMCRLVWRRFERLGRFAYGIGFEGTTFDATGRLVLGPNSHGLTCATLILAVMESAGIPVVDESTWPVRTEKDREFLDFVRPFATPEHFAVLESEVNAGVRRIHPDEVVGACALDQRPANFEAARLAADEVLRRLAAG
jgi:hypothetical protein